jgi:hypothetical protein
MQDEKTARIAWQLNFFEKLDIFTPNIFDNQA